MKFEFEKLKFEFEKFEFEKLKFEFEKLKFEFEIEFEIGVRPPADPQATSRRAREHVRSPRAPQSESSLKS